VLEAEEEIFVFGIGRSGEDLGLINFGLVSVVALI
jgi:D-arabinose 5-phosphate isomerase GutQ